MLRLSRKWRERLCRLLHGGHDYTIGWTHTTRAWIVIRRNCKHCGAVLLTRKPR